MTISLDLTDATIHFSIHKDDTGLLILFCLSFFLALGGEGPFPDFHVSVAGVTRRRAQSKPVFTHDKSRTKRRICNLNNISVMCSSSRYYCLRLLNQTAACKHSNRLRIPPPSPSGFRQHWNNAGSVVENQNHAFWQLKYVPLAAFAFL